MQIDLKEVRFFVISKDSAYEKRAYLCDQLKALGLQYELLSARNISADALSMGFAVASILKEESIKLPFVILQDHITFREPFLYQYEIPEDTDALYLGQSALGLDLENGSEIPAEFEWVNGKFIRLINNLGAHAVLYISSSFREKALKAIIGGMIDENPALTPNQSLVKIQEFNRVLSPVSNPSGSILNYGENDSSIQEMIALNALTQDFSKVLDWNNIHSLSLFEEGGHPQYLFRDLFIHHSGQKITAIATPNKDFSEILEYQKNIWLTIEDLKIQGKLVETEEGDVLLIDFIHETLPQRLAKKPVTSVEIKCGLVKAKFQLSYPLYQVKTSLAVLVDPQFKWIDFFLEYYLDLLKVDHLFLYLTGFEFNEMEELQRKMLPYIKRAQVSLIPWINQAQESIHQLEVDPFFYTHALNRYGQGDWIGFIKGNDYLHIEKHGLKDFLIDLQENGVKGFISSRKFLCYQGDEDFDKFRNPIEKIKTAVAIQGESESQILLVDTSHFRIINKPLISSAVDQGELKYLKAPSYHLKAGLSPAELTQTRNLGVDATLFRSYEELVKTERLQIVVDRALSMALKGESRLIENGLANIGRATPRMKNFLNHLPYWQFRRVMYLGYFDYSIIWPIIYRNFFFFTIICPLPEENEEEIIQDIRKYSGATRLKILNAHWREADPEFYDEGFHNVFIFAGINTYEEIYALILEAYPRMDDTTLLLFLDWNEPTTQKGVKDALEYLNPKILFRRLIPTKDESDANWGNGIGIFAIRKDHANKGDFAQFFAEFRKQVH